MNYLIFFVAVFIFINIIYRLFVIRKDNALNKMKTSKDVLLLCRISKIKLEDYDFKNVVKKLSFANSLIISVISTLVLLLESIIKNFYIWVLVTCIGGVIILIPVIYLTYKIVGKRLRKKEI